MSQAMAAEAAPAAPSSSSCYILGNVAFDVANRTRAKTTGGEDTLAPLEFFTRIPSIPHGSIRSVAAGDRHCVFIVNDEVWGFGANSHGQLHPSFPPVSYQSRRLPLPPMPARDLPVEVACGHNHTMIRYSSGVVLSCGDDSMWQLGHALRKKFDPAADYSTPASKAAWREVTLPHGASKIAASGNTSFAIVGAAGALFSWGCQMTGSLGHGTIGLLTEVGKMVFECINPRSIAFFVSNNIKVIDVSCSAGHCLARDDKHRVYAWGQNGFGQLGSGDTQDSALPRLVEVGDPADRVLSIAAGTDHSVVVKKSGIAQVYVFGRENQGGDGVLKPTRVLYGVANDVVAAFAGTLFSFLLGADGSLYTWGYMNSSLYSIGNLSLFGSANKRFPAQIECLEGKYITHLAVGQRFAVAVGDDSRFRPLDNPENSTLDVMVSMSDRVVLGMNLPNSTARPADLYERSVKGYYQAVLGTTAGLTAFEALPKATPIPPKAQYVLKPRHAHGLRKGTRVRVWFEDVYALGTVSGRDMEGYGKNEFEIKWLRDDWGMDVVELLSDDETLDEENPNRWQALWFVPEPDGDENGGGVTEHQATKGARKEKR